MRSTTLTREQEKKLLIGLLAAFALVVAYRLFSGEKPKTAPLAFPRGSVAASPVRSGRFSSSGSSDPVEVLMARRGEKFPGVARDLFRMENPAPKPKVALAPPVPAALTPPVPEKTPAEIAADAARADLSKFRFLGYVTDRESRLFLSKDGELFIVKGGDTVLKNYQVKETGKDYVVLLDTVTRVEARIELAGSAEQAPSQMQPQAPRQMQQQAPRQMQQQTPRQMPDTMPRDP